MSVFQERYLGYDQIITKPLRKYMEENGYTYIAHFVDRNDGDNGVESYSLNIILKKDSDESKILQVWYWENWYTDSEKSANLISQRVIPEGVPMTKSGC
jgi:hypothetical protein